VGQPGANQAFAESNYKNKERFMDEKIAAYIKKIESKPRRKKTQ